MGVEVVPENGPKRPGQEQTSPGTRPPQLQLQLPGRLNHHLQFGSVQCRGQGVSAAAALQAEAAGHPAALQNPPERRWPIAGNSRPQSVARPEEPAQPTWDPGWTVDGWKGARASRKKGQRWAATLDRDMMAQKPAHLFQDPIPSAGHSSTLARRLRQAQHSAFSIQLGAQHSARQQTRCSRKRDAAGKYSDEHILLLNLDCHWFCLFSWSRSGRSHPGRR